MVAAIGHFVVETDVSAGNRTYDCGCELGFRRELERKRRLD
jgi:hypothetical protein